MKEAQKNAVLSLFMRSIGAIIEDKRKDPKFIKKLNKLNVKVNFGLQIEKNEHIWFNFISDKGNVEINKERLEDNYDLAIKSVPEDLMFFTNGENSLFHMLFTKNKYGMRKLKIEKGTTGRNLKKLLIIPAILSLDNEKTNIK